MNCTSAVEKITECARRRSEPESALGAHLNACRPCRELWEAEQSLTAHLRVIRLAVSRRRSSAASRDALMRQFAEKHQAAANSRWLWSLAAAAAVLLALILVQGLERRPRPAVASQPAGQSIALHTEAQTATDADDPLVVPSDAQADAPGDGFIPVPYVPPLATGELVSVVHTELLPAALATLGVSVDPAWATELPADLLVGEDGFPRAVRVSADYSDERGF